MGVFRKAYKSMFERNKWKILRGDKVMIMAGKDRGQVGTVTKVIRDEKYPRVIVEGLNLNKRFIKRTKDNPGGIISVESPLHYSNVSLIDPVTNSPVKVATRYLEDGTKVRVSRGKLASGSIIPRPDILKQRRKPLPASPGPLDTAPGLANQVTHTPGDLPTALKQMLQQQQSRSYSSMSASSGGSILVSGSSIILSRNNYPRNRRLYSSTSNANYYYHSFASSAL